MKLLFAVDQKASLRAGIDAPSSTVQLDIDPATLTAAERDILASRMVDGHEVRGGIAITPPTIEGVRAALAEIIQGREQKAADEAVAKAQREEKAINELREEMAATNKTETVFVYLDADGGASTDSYQSVMSGRVTVRRIPVLTYQGGLPPEYRRQADEFIAAVKAERQAAIDAEAERMRSGPWAEWKAGKDAAESDYRSLYGRLPEVLRKRDAERLTKDNEVEREIRKLIRQDAGLAQYGSWSWGTAEAADSLTDAEFLALEAFREKLPAGSKVELLDAWDWSDTPETDEYGELKVDDDGDEVYTKVNHRRVARATWSRAGVKVAAVCTLTPPKAD